MPVIVGQVHRLLRELDSEEKKKEIVAGILEELAKFSDKIGPVTPGQISFVGVAVGDQDMVVIISGAEDVLEEREREKLQKEIRLRFPKEADVEVVVTSPRRFLFK